MKRKSKVINCKYFKSCGNVFGGCKNTISIHACIYEYLDECNISERKYKIKN